MSQAKETLMRRVLLLLPLIVVPSACFASTGPTTPTFTLSWGTFGTAPTQLYYPFSVTTDALGNVYVPDHKDRIQKFDRLGNFITGWGSTGSSDGQFDSPTGVATDAAGTSSSRTRTTIASRSSAEAVRT
jgi:hypothetical protein